MNKTHGLAVIACLGGVAVAGSSMMARAQGQPPPDRPAVTVRGQTYTPRSILARNMGTDADQTSQFPPHKVIGNIYYVGTRVSGHDAPGAHPDQHDVRAERAGP